MKKIAVANLKGGVGKTTTAIILADMLSAMAGKRVLSLDLDSQANMSWALVAPSPFEQIQADATLAEWVGSVGTANRLGLSQFLVDVSLAPHTPVVPIPMQPPPVRPVHHIAVANTKMRFAEMSYEGPLQNDPSEQISDALIEDLDALSGSFEYCVMDCSPALSAMTRAGLRVADVILIPTPLNSICIQSSINFQDFAMRDALNISETPSFVVITRVGASGGAAEMGRARTRLKDHEAAGRWKILNPEFKENVRFTRALDPPELNPHHSLRRKYNRETAALKNFLESLKDHGIVSNE